jgi:hypothetical protein
MYRCAYRTYLYREEKTPHNNQFKSMAMAAMAKRTNKILATDHREGMM